MAGTTTSPPSTGQDLPRLAVGDWITAGARKHPDRTCLLDHTGATHSFHEVDERSTRLAWALCARGLRPGDRLAILGVDSVEHVLAILACLKAGIVFCDLNYRLSGSEIATLTELLQPSAFAVDQRYAHHVPAGAHVLALDGAGPNTVAAIVADPEATGPDLTARVAHGEELVSIALTSGTTGRPKAVLQSERMIRNLVHIGLREFRVTVDDLRYSAAPLFHIAGIGWIYYAILAGAASLVLSQFDASTTVRWLATGRVTNCLMVPTMLHEVLDLAERDDLRFPAVRSITYGGAPMTLPLLQRVIDVFDCDLFNSYGAGTEAGPGATLYPEDHRAAAAGQPALLESVGRPVPGVDLRICDDAGRDVATGELGEIAVRSETIMSGYLAQPREEWPIVDGWFHTGDLGRLDRDGFLYLAGRRSDMIIRGGENIFPAEAQTVLEQHPAVARVAVVGLADARWGEIVAAAVVTVQGATITEDELAEFCRGRLAGFKTPTRYTFVDELPTNSTGKVRPAAVRALFAPAADPDA